MAAMRFSAWSWILLFILALLVGGFACSLLSSQLFSWNAPEPPIRQASPLPTIGPTAVGSHVSPSPTPEVVILSTTPALSQQLAPATLLPPPAPTPTPVPLAILRQLTDGGCCVQPFWSPDGERVLFLDRPDSQSPAGFWGVGLEGGAAELYTTRLGLYSPNMDLMAFPHHGQTVIEQLSTGQQWIIPNGEREVVFSPDGSQVAWSERSPGPPFDTNLRLIWVSRSDGEQAAPVASLHNGGVAGWFPDGRLLAVGRFDTQEREPAYWVVQLDDLSITEIARGSRLRGAALSPGGSWLAYQVVFGEDPAGNGLWLANTTTGEHRQVDLFGAYRWRDDGRLLVIPLELGAPSHQVWEVAAASGEARPLTSPELTPFKIANGDWSLSPDGKHIAFVSASDRNIWLLSLDE